MGDDAQRIPAAHDPAVPSPMARPRRHASIPAAASVTMTSTPYVTIGPANAVRGETTAINSVSSGWAVRYVPSGA